MYRGEKIIAGHCQSWMISSDEFLLQSSLHMMRNITIFITWLALTSL